MVEQRPQRPGPVQNSEVYVLRQVAPFSTIPPLSPPSPITPAEDNFCTPLEALRLSQPTITACKKKLAVEERLSRAVHVLATEATALQNLAQLYSADRFARDSFSRAVDAIIRRQQSGNDDNQGRNGKVVVIGVGKSGHIAKKLVATFNSLAIQAVFLHPTEALHGDLGQISSRHDTLLLITFSGKTPELLLLLPHLDPSLPLILLTSHTRPETCEIVRLRPDTILLPAPVHEAETASFGVAAPTTSTTVALTVGDALAIVASKEMHACVSEVFRRNHPGGAIGQALRHHSAAGKAGREGEDVRGLAVAVGEMGELVAGEDPLTGADVLRVGYSSASGWVRLGDNGGVITPRRIRRLRGAEMGLRVPEELGWMVTGRSEFIPVAAGTSVARAAEWIRGLRSATFAGGNSSNEECGPYGDEAVIAVMERGECVGLLEVGGLLDVA
jgi:D-arabinose 5-phosphate isomerase GutQ